MFAAPPVIETEIFARVPDSLRIRNQHSARPGPHHDCFLEGPSFDRAGNLYCVDIPWGRIFRVSPAGEISVVAEYDGEPNGMKMHKDGHLIIADRKRGLLVLDPESGTLTSRLDRPSLEGFKGLNDLIFAANGDLYFTDQGESGLQSPTGRLFCLRKDGRLDLLLDNIPSPNGLCLTPDETILYLAVTRSNAIWRVPLTLLPGGGVTRVGVFVYMSGGTGPDGIAMDEEGSLCVAHIGFGTVWQFSRRGEPVSRIVSCTGQMVTNVAYGGPDRRTLYITESETGTILTARLEKPGLRLYGDT